MISSQPLINKICCALTTGGLTPVQCCSAESALTILCQPVFSVANIAALPNATTYNGRMVYVTDQAKYYYAVQGVWDANFSSVPHAVRCDLYAWGAAAAGQLGDNTTVNKSSPVSVIGGFIDWCQISGIGGFSLAVRTNGTAWTWGCGNCGQLGDNTTVNKSSPVSVLGGFTDWCQISGGICHSLAVRQNGTAWGWGLGSQGRLGDNTTVSKSSPVSVVGGFCDWCQVSGGASHSLALRTNGTAWAWGFNTNGNLGDNTAVSKSSPVSVVGGFTDWCQVSASDNFSLAVRTNGTAWSWGSNYFGRLGDNTATANRSSPVSVVGGFTDWCQISGGNQFSLAVRTNGTAWAWGYAADGRLGNNTTVNRSSPVSVIGGFTDWCQISGGVSHSLAVRQNGTAWGWGVGSLGRLGNNCDSNRSSPVSVVGGFTTWAQVSAGCIQSIGRTITTVPLQSI
jgi:alpha-tubulin suppressor-like RCC1 family protein